MEQFIHQNGYVTVFLTVAFAGELGLITGAALAQTGSVTLTGVVILGTAASFIGNTIYYFIGKFLWNRWSFLKRRFGDQVEESSSFVNRYGSPSMLVARFLFGIRDVVPIALGVYRVGIGLFTLYNVVGAFIWAFLFTVMGKEIYGLVPAWLRGVQAGVYFGIVLSVMVLAIYAVMRRVAARRKT